MADSFTFNEKGHYYELDGKRMHGVTTVLGVIAKPMLIGWAAKQTAEWIRENCEEIEGDANGWLVNESQLQEAAKAHTRKKEAGGEKGTDVHALVEEYVKARIADGVNVVLDGQLYDPALKAFSRWATSNNVQFLASEKRMYSESWFTAGTADFVFEKGGKTYIGDLKSFKRIWDKIPAYQVAAYAKMWAEMGNKPVDGTCIVNISKETNELTEQWFYNLEEDTKCFEAALLLYKSMQNF